MAQGVVAFQAAPRARPAAGTADRDDHAPRPRSSTPSARPPARWPTGSRRGAGRSPPPRPPHQRRPPRSAAKRLERVRRTRPPRQSRCPRRRPARAPATAARRRLRVLRGWWPRSWYVAEAARMASIRSAAASSTCSQLSNTSSRTLPSNAAATALGHALAGLLGDAQHRGHRVGHRRRIGDRGQLEKPDPVGKFIGQPRRDLQRQPGLADPTHPGQRDQPMSLHRGLQLADLGLAPDEARGRRPQVPRTRIQRPQRGKSVCRPAARTWNTPTGVGRSRNRRGPRSTRSTPLSRPAVDSANRI